ELARCLNNLGGLLQRLGRRDAAEAEYRQAIALLKQLAGEFPEVPDHAVMLGRSYGNLGNVFTDSGKPAEALEWYQLAIQTLAPVVGREPRLAGPRQVLRNSHLGRAIALTKLDRFAEAIPDWERAIEFDEGPSRPSYRLERALCLARVEPARAVAEAEELVR